MPSNPSDRTVQQNPMNRSIVLHLLLLVCLSPSCRSLTAVDRESDDSVEWKILTKQNFSSQSRTHPHALLVVTLPWSGEARSLMKDIALAVRNGKEQFGSLKLLYMYKNVEKMLADAIGASDETTVIYYHHSTSYNYRGRLRAGNILSSVLPYLTVPPEDIPLKHLKSEEELNDFLNSTDRGVLLLEFCGWTPKLLNKCGNSSTENGFVSVGNFAETTSDVVKNRISTVQKRYHQKSLENGFMQCGLENQANGIPWLGEFSSLSDNILEVEEVGADPHCNFEEFHRFESFFSEFITSVREFFLPSERQKFGLISEKALLTQLQVGELDSWSVSVQYAGCPSCSKNIHEGDDLKSVLQDDGGLVLNLEDNRHNVEAALPANKPSMLLLVDRSSDSSEVQIKSNEALYALRELALLHCIPTKGQKAKRKNPGKLSVRSFLSSRSTSRHPTFKLYSSHQRVKSGDKMSIVIVNEGNDGNLDKLTSDIQQNSLHDVFAYLLQQKREAKLSSLAKKAGFELLSDDIEVKISSPSSSRTEDQPVKDVLEDCGKGLSMSQIDQEKDQLMGSTNLPAPGVEEKLESVILEPSESNGKYKNLVGTSKESAQTELEDLVTIIEPADPKVAEEDNTSTASIDELEKQLPQCFKGSFYFCDGDYQLLRALTGSSKIPSLVIIDPVLQQHYMLPAEENISYIALVNFLNSYLNKSLLPYQKSESILPVSKDAVRPPFVNLDFHEADAIPRITAESFSKMMRFNWSEYRDSTSPQRKDVLVLFSNSWCGFCHRMELVVREVYRAIKGYISLLAHKAENGGALLSADNSKGIKQSLPLIYMMDCTCNDCSLILNSVNQRELYPTLVLFPTGNKDPVSYEGDIAVSAIIKFIASQGSYSHLHSKQTGMLWTLLENQSPSVEFLEKRSSNGDHKEDPTEKLSLHEVMLGKRMPERVVKYKWVVSRETHAKQKVAPHVAVGSILLATDKLLGAHPFDKSMVLLVKADMNSGFQGLIINKPVSWDSISQLQEGYGILKEAPLSFGGPLIPQGFPLVALTRKADEAKYPEVLLGIFFIDQSATIREIEEIKSGTQVVANYWFFLGYASWNWNQLFDEIAEGAWTISDDSTGEFNWPVV